MTVCVCQYVHIHWGLSLMSMIALKNVTKTPCWPNYLSTHFGCRPVFNNSPHITIIQLLPPYGACHDPQWGAPSSVCFHGMQSPVILTGTSLQGWTGIPALHTPIHWVGLEPSPVSLSTASRGPSSYAVITLLHWVATTSFLFFLLNDEHVMPWVPSSSPSHSTSCPKFIHASWVWVNSPVILMAMPKSSVGTTPGSDPSMFPWTRVGSVPMPSAGCTVRQFCNDVWPGDHQ